MRGRPPSRQLGPPDQTCPVGKVRRGGPRGRRVRRDGPRSQLSRTRHDRCSCVRVFTRRSANDEVHPIRPHVQGHPRRCTDRRRGGETARLGHHESAALARAGIQRHLATTRCRKAAPGPSRRLPRRKPVDASRSPPARCRARGGPGRGVDRSRRRHPPRRLAACVEARSRGRRLRQRRTTTAWHPSDRQQHVLRRGTRSLRRDTDSDNRADRAGPGPIPVVRRRGVGARSRCLSRAARPGGVRRSRRSEPRNARRKHAAARTQDDAVRGRHPQWPGGPRPRMARRAPLHDPGGERAHPCTGPNDAGGFPLATASLGPGSGRPGTSCARHDARRRRSGCSPQGRRLDGHQMDAR